MAEEACCERCAQLAGCGAWSWNQGYAPQSCWLKRSCPSRTNDSSVISGVIKIDAGNKTMRLTMDAPVTTAVGQGVRVGVVGDPVRRNVRTLASCVPL